MIVYKNICLAFLGKTGEHSQKDRGFPWEMSYRSQPIKRSGFTASQIVKFFTETQLNLRSSFVKETALLLKPHLHALKNRHGTSNFWRRAQTSLARHYPFTRSETKDFSAAGHGSNY